MEVVQRRVNIRYYNHLLRQYGQEVAQNYLRVARNAPALAHTKGFSNGRRKKEPVAPGTAQAILDLVPVDAWVKKEDVHRHYPRVTAVTVGQALSYLAKQGRLQMRLRDRRKEYRRGEAK